MCTVRQVRRVMNRILSISVLVLLVAVSVSAYTIVMRDGRRLEIPSRFVVTPSTVTYEVQDGNSNHFADVRRSMWRRLKKPTTSRLAHCCEGRS